MGIRVRQWQKSDCRFAFAEHLSVNDVLLGAVAVDAGFVCVVEGEDGGWSD